MRPEARAAAPRRRRPRCRVAILEVVTVLGLGLALAVGGPAPVNPVDGASLSPPDASERRTRALDLLGLPAILQTLERPPEARLIDVTYQIRMATVGAGCPRETERVFVSTLDDDVRRTYKRLSCTSAPERIAQTSFHSRLSLYVGLARSSRKRVRPGEAFGLQATILRASEISRVAPSFLWTTARLESGFRPEARSSASSAAGLFQFLSSTWLASLRRYGAGLGMNRAAAAIDVDERGRPLIRDRFARREILALREDPLVSATLAGLLTRENAETIAASERQKVTEDELYAAHVLGPTAALRLYKTAALRPGVIAADVLHRQAETNPGLFFDRSRPRTAAELVAEFERRTDL